MSELDYLRKRVTALEAAQEVSACLHEYMQECDYLNEGTDLNPLMELFTEDAIWEGKGQRYAATFGRLEGRDAITAMFKKYTLPPAHFELNVHFLTSEKISIKNESEAVGTWVLLQTATFADGRSQLSSALLNVDFRKEEGHWKISHFCTTSRFNRPVQVPWDNQQALPVPK